jgi:hypothetical protein
VPRTSGVRLEPVTRTAFTCFVALALYGSSAIGSGAVSRSAALAAPVPRTRFAAIAFDYLVRFNPDSVVTAVDEVFPGKGRAFTEVWRTGQFEYSWLRSMAGRYVDFSTLTEDALAYAGGLAAPLEIAFQIHARIEARNLISVAVEHLRRTILEETRQPDFPRLAPARMIDRRIHVCVEPILLWRLALPRSDRLLLDQPDSYD